MSSIRRRKLKIKLIVGGLNHKTANLELREKFSLTQSRCRELLSTIKQMSQIEEGLVLSTCNRTEFYFLVEDNIKAKDLICEVFNLLATVAVKKLNNSLYIYSNLEAVKHLYEVVSGLDSLVVGETQILAQVKSSFEVAQEFGLVDSYFHQLFTEALRVGKRVRTETKINHGAASVSYAAVELAEQIFGCLTGETVLILGAGKMSELTLKSLVDHGVKGIMVSNRTHSRAQKLADKFAGQAIKWHQLEDWIHDIDIVISSTGAPHYVLHYDLVNKVMQEQCRGPLFLIDIAVPRDIEPQVENIAGVHLYDIDDLNGVVDENIEQRKEELDEVEEIIATEIDRFEEWLKEEQITPVIKEMRQQAHRIKDEELLKVKQKLETGDDSEEIVEEFANKLTNKLLHKPTIKLKEIASEGSAKQLKFVEKLFD
jgi:glutamyl-tRNA reductase